MNEAEDERYAVELEKEYDKKREKKKSIKQIGRASCRERV